MADSAGLLDALLAVQAQAPTLKKDETATVTSRKGSSYKYSYVSLDSIVEKVGPILAEHGLVWMTKPGANEHGQPVLNYTLAHAPSGQREEGSMPLFLAENDSQSHGSAITYARRYCLCSVLNLVADEDDDGNKASEARSSSDTPSPAQLKELARQMKMAKPTTDVLRAMLKVVGTEGVTEEELANGLWSAKVSRQQVSGLLDMLKEGKLPTGESDVPNPDDIPAADTPDPDLPFDAVGAEHES